MNNKTATILLAAGVATGAAMHAQETRTGYFLDEYTYRFQMNPAEGNAKNYVSMPVLGNLNVGMAGTLHLNAILYNVDGKTTTFLNPGVPASEVMGRLHDKNRLDASVKINLLSGGWKAWGGYNTVTISARVDEMSQLPKSLFKLAKEGVTNRNYEIKGVRSHASAYSEIALNHSRPINDEWRVGASVKFVLGFADIAADFNKADLTLGKESWDIVANAYARASIKNFSWKTSVNESTGERYVDGMDGGDFAVNGFGLGFDLGAVYTPKALPDWKFSAAFTDIGFISWNNNVEASTNGDRTFTTDTYIFSVDNDAPNSFSKEWDRMRDGLESVYQMEDNGDVGRRTTSLYTTINLGVNYTLPVYRPLTFGLLNTTRIAGDYSWTDFRLSANVAPCNMFSAAASFEFGTFGVGFGWLVNLHVTGFNLFAGMDHTMGKLAKQGVPLNSNASFNFGMNFLF